MNNKEQNNTINKNSLQSKRVINISDLYKLFKKDSKKGLIGSKNFGNTCYMNSAIACFSNTIELTTYFLTKQYKDDLNPENKLGCQGKLANEWYKLLKEYWIGNKKKGDPSKLKSIISKHIKTFKGDEQQDVHEFITFFLDYLSEDLNKVKKKTYIEIEEQKKDENDIDCSLRFWDLHIKRNDSIITDLFTGQYKSTIKCPKCNWISRTYDPFNTISLPIPDRKFDKNEIFIYILIYYIPIFSIETTLKISLYVNQDITYNDITEEIIKIKNFPYNVKSLIYMEVVEKKCINIYNNNEKFCNENFTFLYEKDDEKCDITIPLYFCKYDEEKGYVLSAFPRFLCVYKKMTFSEFKKKIFFFTRQYIKLPIFEDENVSENNFENIYSNNDKESNNDDKIKLLIEIMEKEYKKIIENKNNRYEEYFNDFPYCLYLQKNLFENDISKRNNKKTINQEKIYLINYNKKKDDLEENFSNLSLKDDTISKIIKLCGEDGKGEYYLVLEFFKKSKFVKKNQLRFNSSTKLEVEKKKKKKIHMNIII